MTDLEKRIVILTHMGWTELTQKGRRGEDGPFLALRGTNPKGAKNQIPPNPITNLNAMHEAEKTLVDPTQRFAYEAILHTLNTPHGLGISVWETVHATAAQRAEAFLMTLSNAIPPPDHERAEGQSGTAAV